MRSRPSENVKTPLPSRWARTAPPLLRGAMTPAPWFGFWRGLLFALWPGARWPADARPPRPWHAAAQRRRAVLIGLVTLLTGAALMLRLNDAPADPGAWWWATTALMTLLFAWVGIGCATAVMGAWALWRGDRQKRWHLSEPHLVFPNPDRSSGTGTRAR